MKPPCAFSMSSSSPPGTSPGCTQPKRTKPASARPSRTTTDSLLRAPIWPSAPAETLYGPERCSTVGDGTMVSALMPQMLPCASK
eukprot:4328504-Prymnesium_polylepis.1